MFASEMHATKPELDDRYKIVPSSTAKAQELQNKLNPPESQL